MVFDVDKVSISIRHEDCHFYFKKRSLFSTYINESWALNSIPNSNIGYYVYFKFYV
jgi:hypothetical protein